MQAELYDIDDDDDFGYLSDDDYSRYESSKRRRLRNRAAAAIRPPPVITFAELYEQALSMHKQRESQRKVKIYFDHNDEFVREE